MLISISCRPPSAVWRIWCLMPWHPAMDVMWFMVPMVKYRFLPLFFVFRKHRFGFDPFLNNPKPGHGNEWALFYEWEPSSQSENRAVKEIENDLSLSSSLLSHLWQWLQQLELQWRHKLWGPKPWNQVLFSVFSCSFLTLFVVLMYVCS